MHRASARPDLILSPPFDYAQGRFVVHRVGREEAEYKLCKVRRLEVGKGGVPYIATHDGRTIRYPDPDIKVSAGSGERQGQWTHAGGRQLGMES